MTSRILVHDNASRDGTQALLREWAPREPRMRVQESATNVGYAAGHNAAIRDARGEVIVLLNQDVELDRGFLSAIVAAFEAHPEVGSVQPRLRQLAAPGERLATLDTTGLAMGRDRRAVSRAQGLPDGPEHQRSEVIWGVDGPVPAYRRSALREAALRRPDGSWEVLDEDFFLYKEDVDLAWRLRRLGWQAWYEPDALGWHGRGSGGTGATTMLDIARTNRGVSSRVRRLSWRNQRLMQIKNEDPASITCAICRGSGHVRSSRCSSCWPTIRVTWPRSPTSSARRRPRGASAGCSRRASRNSTAMRCEM